VENIFTKPGIVKIEVSFKPERKDGMICEAMSQNIIVPNLSIVGDRKFYHNLLDKALDDLKKYVEKESK